MTVPTPIMLDTVTALRERQSDPVHVPPPGLPLGSEVEITLTGNTNQPDVLVTDTRRPEFTWRVAMTPDPAQPDRWTARLKMPSVPTVVHYHFAFADGTVFFALRQVESLIPQTPDAYYGKWVRRPFQIAVYDPAAMPPAWTQGQVIYQIFPDRFAKADIPTRPRRAVHVHGREPLFHDWDEPQEIPPKGRDFYGGNLRGILEKLDYLKALGVDCIYLTPIFEAPSNHRYDAMDYFNIDPLLGTEQDLRDLVAAVHQRGMRIMLDGVFNHCSNDSQYFNASGWYGENEGAARSRHSPYYRWFEFQNHPKDYTGWVGVKSMPEFVECPEVEEFFLGANGVSNYWLRTGIDGWRTDVTPWVSDEFWRRFRRSVRATNPEAYLISEEWNDASHYLVGEMFDGTMNYRLALALRGFFALDALSLLEFHERIDGLIRDTPPPALLSQTNLIDSHDTARALTHCQGDQHRFTQMVAFLFAYPGSPMIFAGDEVGVEGAFAEDARRPFPWGGGDTALRDFFQRALAFRRQSPALRYGTFEVVLADETHRAYVFARHKDGETVYAAFNASDAPAELVISLASNATHWMDALGRLPDLTADGTMLRIALPARGAAWYAAR